MVPAKLVCEILNGEFIDMAELLKDNMEQERRRQAADADGMYSGKYDDKEGNSECDELAALFHVYAAVVCSRYSHKARELWAY